MDERMDELKGCAMDARTMTGVARGALARAIQCAAAGDGEGVAAAVEEIEDAAEKSASEAVSARRLADQIGGPEAEQWRDRTFYMADFCRDLVQKVEAELQAASEEMANG